MLIWASQKAQPSVLFYLLRRVGRSWLRGLELIAPQSRDDSSNRETWSRKGSHADEGHLPSPAPLLVPDIQSRKREWKKRMETIEIGEGIKEAREQERRKNPPAGIEFISLHSTGPVLFLPVTGETKHSHSSRRTTLPPKPGKKCIEKEGCKSKAGSPPISFSDR